MMSQNQLANLSLSLPTMSINVQYIIAVRILMTSWLSIQTSNTQPSNAHVRNDGAEDQGSQVVHSWWKMHDEDFKNISEGKCGDFKLIKIGTTQLSTNRKTSLFSSYNDDLLIIAEKERLVNLQVWQELSVWLNINKYRKQMNDKI